MCRSVVTAGPPLLQTHPSLAKRLVRSSLLAALLTAVLLGAASVALFVTSAPALISLLAEPFSLLLTPGFLLCLPFVGNHNEVSPTDVLRASVCFYFLVFLWMLVRWPAGGRAHSRSR